MKLRLAISAALTLLAGCATQPHATLPYATPTTSPSVSASGRIKLADWNLEFLAEKDGTGCHPRSQADYDALKQTVDAIHADVFAFEEVENEGAAARIFDPTKYVVVMETRPGKPGGSCGGQHPEKRFIRQAVGIAIRRGLDFQRLPDLTDLQIGNPNLRSGVDVLVTPRGGEPLRILAVHLKSGCFQGETGRACPEILQQMPVVRAWVESATRTGIRFAIMGDWNRRLALPGDVFWSTIGMREPADAALILADAGMAAHCDPRYRDFIDHIVLDQRAGGQVADFSETTFPEGRRPSDHCPISITLPR